SRLEPEIKIFAQQLGRKGHLEIQIDQCRRLITREYGSHDTVVHELQQGMPRKSRLFRQHDNFGQRLTDDAQKHVVADFCNTGELAGTDVTDSSGPENLQEWTALIENVLGTGTDDR